MHRHSEHLHPWHARGEVAADGGRSHTCSSWHSPRRSEIHSEIHRESDACTSYLLLVALAAQVGDLRLPLLGRACIRRPPRLARARSRRRRLAPLRQIPRDLRTRDGAGRESDDDRVHERARTGARAHVEVDGSHEALARDAQVRCARTRRDVTVRARPGRRRGRGGKNVRVGMIVRAGRKDARVVDRQRRSGPACQDSRRCTAWR